MTPCLQNNIITINVLMNDEPYVVLSKRSVDVDINEFLYNTSGSNIFYTTSSWNKTPRCICFL